MLWPRNFEQEAPFHETPLVPPLLATPRRGTRRGLARRGVRRRARGRARRLRHGALLGRRLDRHHRHHGGHRRGARGARLRDGVRAPERAVTYTSLANGDVDVFLGNWMPTMEADIAPLPRGGHGRDRAHQPSRAPSTPSRPTPRPAALGIDSFEAIAEHAEALEGEIYGIEPGNDGNRLIQDMIDADAFGLGGFEVVESSEQGMLAQVGRATRRDEPVVFLGWEPHPMNANFDLTYLEGRATTSSAPISAARRCRPTCARATWEACENVGRFLGNLVFSLEMENEIMGAILDDGQEPEAAADGVAARQPGRARRLAGRRHAAGRHRRHAGRGPSRRWKASEARRGDGSPAAGGHPDDASGGHVMEEWLTGTRLPIGSAIDGFVELLNAHASGVFDAIADSLGFLIEGATRRSPDGAAARADRRVHAARLGAAASLGA